VAEISVLSFSIGILHDAAVPAKRQARKGECELVRTRL
jgi:hypothetical protein